MKPFSRSDRVAGQIQKALSDLLRKEISDPRLEGATITGVKMAADLKSAKVYFISLGGKRDGAQAAEGFNSAIGYLKRSLAAKLGLRYMPDLKFFYDESFDYGSRIDKMLKNLSRENESDVKSTEKE